METLFPNYFYIFSKLSLYFLIFELCRLHPSSDGILDLNRIWAIKTVSFRIWIGFWNEIVGSD